MKPLFLLTWAPGCQSVALKLLPLVREAAAKCPGLVVTVKARKARS